MIINDDDILNEWRRLLGKFVSFVLIILIGCNEMVVCGIWRIMLLDLVNIA